MTASLVHCKTAMQDMKKKQRGRTHSIKTRSGALHSKLFTGESSSLQLWGKGAGNCRACSCLHEATRALTCVQVHLRVGGVGPQMGQLAYSKNSTASHLV
jgi:hypothetical protein